MALFINRDERRTISTFYKTSKYFDAFIKRRFIKVKEIKRIKFYKYKIVQQFSDESDERRIFRRFYKTSKYFDAKRNKIV